MLRELTKMLRIRPRTAVLIVFLLTLLGGGIGVPLYVHRQWRAAQAAVKADRLDEAKERLRVCQFFNYPGRLQVNILAARAARLSGDFEQAEAHLNRLKFENDDTGAIEVEFLLMRVQRGEVDEVAPLLLKCVENKHPESALILRTLSGAFMHNLRYRPALFFLSRWIQVAPEEAEAYNWRGSILERIGSSERAVQDYKKAIELDPELFSARLRLAEMYLEKSNPRDALPHLAHLREQFPDRPVIMARMGQCLYLQGELEEARLLLEAALVHLPDDPALLVHLAKLELQQRQPAKAERWLLSVLKTDPTDTEARYTLGKCLQLQGREKEAEAAFALYKSDKELLRRASIFLQEDAERPTGTADELFEIAGIFLRTRQDRLSFYWLDQALRRDPQHQPSHRALAELYEKRGQREKAANHRLLAEKDKHAGPP